MGALDWTVLAAVTVLAVLAVRRYRKKGNSCSGNCAACKGCPHKK